MLLQLAAETPQLSPLSITHVLSCLEATSHRSDTWFEILTKVQWYEYSSYVYLVDSKTAFRSLLCDQCFSEWYWGAWSKLLLQGGTYTPLRVGSSRLGKASLWAIGRLPFSLGSPGQLGNLSGKGEVLFLLSPKLASVCSFSKNLNPRITLRVAQRPTAHNCVCALKLWNNNK